MSRTYILIAYASFSAVYIFELVLFFLALWIGIQYFRNASSTNQIGARRLRLILVEGNVLYFLAWVSSFVHHALTNIHRLMVYQAVYLTVVFTSSVRHYLSHETQPDNVSSINISLSQVIFMPPCTSLPAAISSCVFELQPRCRLLAQMPPNIPVSASRTILSWSFVIPLPIVKPHWESIYKGGLLLAILYLRNIIGDTTSILWSTFNVGYLHSSWPM